MPQLNGTPGSSGTVADHPLAEDDRAAEQSASIPGQFSRVLVRNIDGLVAARREEERRRTTQQRLSDTVTRFTGSLQFVYLHAGCSAVGSSGTWAGFPACPRSTRVSLFLR
jgi:hypothetical protein